MKLGSGAVAGMVRGAAIGPSTVFSGISIDSRTIETGDLFVAIKGPTHDGHDFLPQALVRGAGALVSRPVDPESIPLGRTLIQVADTLAALQSLAKNVRETRRLSVVAITGSVGKTTTKEMTATVLSRRFRTARSRGNLNNTIGLPLEVARLPEDTEVAVLEMGMSTPGEIHRLSELFRPDIGVVTAVAPVHLMNFASLDEVMNAKGEILDGMSASSTFVANADDERSLAIGRRHTGRVVTYGLSGAPELFATATDIVEDADGTRFTLRVGSDQAPAAVPLPGRHNLSDFLAAAAVAGARGMTAREIAAAAPELKPARHRGEVHPLAGGGVLYDDSYNSSPVALAASYDAFTRVASARRKVAVIGEMLELGKTSEDLHREAGRRLAGRCDLLVAVRGDAAALAEGAREGGMPADAIRFVPDTDAATEAVRTLLLPGDALFVKGSRGVALDRLVEAVR